MSLASLQNHASKLKHRSCPHPSWRSLRIAAPPRTRVLRKTACAAQRVSTDVVVIGAGAAGLTAAYFAAKEGAQVTVLEKNQESGRKILISGGTRCNVLPSQVDISRDYFTESSKSAIKAVFASWSLEKCKEWLESRQYIGLALAHEADDSKYFPVSNSAKEVRDKLVLACQKAGVTFRYQAQVEQLQQSRDGAEWQCRLANGASMETQSIVLASGGLSYPHLGTDGDGHRILKQLGHSLHPTYPALTPLLGTHPGNSQLAGVSLYGVAAAAQGPKSSKRGKRSSTPAQRGGWLFTHRGFSGPAVLDLSHHKVMAMLRGTAQPDLKVNWAGLDVEAWQEILRTAGGSAVQAVLHKRGLPKRLAEALCQELHIVGTPVAQLRKADKLQLLELLTAYRLNVTGHGGYAKAEVTGGGVPLAEINCSTMQSKKLNGLYLCGEVCDVFGRIGGFNFYWAWLSGRLAGLSAAAQCQNDNQALQNLQHHV